MDPHDGCESSKNTENLEVENPVTKFVTQSKKKLFPWPKPKYLRGKVRLNLSPIPENEEKIEELLLTGICPAIITTTQSDPFEEDDNDKNGSDEDFEPFQNPFVKNTEERHQRTEQMRNEITLALESLEGAKSNENGTMPKPTEKNAPRKERSVLSFKEPQNINIPRQHARHGTGDLSNDAKKREEKEALKEVMQFIDLVRRSHLQRSESSRGSDKRNRMSPGSTVATSTDTPPEYDRYSTSTDGEGENRIVEKIEEYFDEANNMMVTTLIKENGDIEVVTRKSETLIETFLAHTSTGSISIETRVFRNGTVMEFTSRGVVVKLNPDEDEEDESTGDDLSYYFPSSPDSGEREDLSISTDQSLICEPPNGATDTANETDSELPSNPFEDVEAEPASLSADAAGDSMQDEIAEAVDSIHEEVAEAFSIHEEVADADTTPDITAITDEINKNHMVVQEIQAQIHSCVNKALAFINEQDSLISTAVPKEKLDDVDRVEQEKDSVSLPEMITPSPYSEIYEGETSPTTCDDTNLCEQTKCDMEELTSLLKEESPDTSLTLGDDMKEAIQDDLAKFLETIDSEFTWWSKTVSDVSPSDSPNTPPLREGIRNHSVRLSRSKRRKHKLARSSEESQSSGVRDSLYKRKKTYRHKPIKRFKREESGSASVETDNPETTALLCKSVKSASTVCTISNSIEVQTDIKIPPTAEISTNTETKSTTYTKETTRGTSKETISKLAKDTSSGSPRATSSATPKETTGMTSQETTDRTPKEIGRASKKTSNKIANASLNATLKDISDSTRKQTLSVTAKDASSIIPRASSTSTTLPQVSLKTEVPLLTKESTGKKVPTHRRKKSPVRNEPPVKDQDAPPTKGPPKNKEPQNSKDLPKSSIKEPAKPKELKELDKHKESPRRRSPSRKVSTGRSKSPIPHNTKNVKLGEELKETPTREVLKNVDLSQYTPPKSGTPLCREEEDSRRFRHRHLQRSPSPHTEARPESICMPLDRSYKRRSRSFEKKANHLPLKKQRRSRTVEGKVKQELYPNNERVGRLKQRFDCFCKDLKSKYGIDVKLNRKEDLRPPSRFNTYAFHEIIPATPKVKIFRQSGDTLKNTPSNVSVNILRAPGISKDEKRCGSGLYENLYSQMSDQQHSSTITDLVSELQTRLTESLTKKISILELTCLSDAEIVSMGDSTTWRSRPGSSRPSSATPIAEVTITTKDDSHEEADQLRIIFDLQEKVKEMGSVCNKFELAVQNGTQLERSFAAVQKSFFHITMSSLKMALVALKDKCNMKDLLVEAMKTNMGGDIDAQLGQFTLRKINNTMSLSPNDSPALVTCSSVEPLINPSSRFNIELTVLPVHVNFGKHYKSSISSSVENCDFFKPQAKRSPYTEQNFDPNQKKKRSSKYSLPYADFEENNEETVNCTLSISLEQEPHLKTEREVPSRDKSSSRDSMAMSNNSSSTVMLSCKMEADMKTSRNGSSNAAKLCSKEAEDTKPISLSTSSTSWRSSDFFPGNYHISDNEPPGDSLISSGSGSIKDYDSIAPDPELSEPCTTFQVPLHKKKNTRERIKVLKREPPCDDIFSTPTGPRSDEIELIYKIRPSMEFRNFHSPTLSNSSTKKNIISNLKEKIAGNLQIESASNVTIPKETNPEPALERVCSLNTGCDELLKGNKIENVRLFSQSQSAERLALASRTTRSAEGVPSKKKIEKRFGDLLSEDSFTGNYFEKIAEVEPEREIPRIKVISKVKKQTPLTKLMLKILETPILCHPVLDDPIPRDVSSSEKLKKLKKWPPPNRAPPTPNSLSSRGSVGGEVKPKKRLTVPKPEGVVKTTRPQHACRFGTAELKPRFTYPGLASPPEKQFIMAGKTPEPKRKVKLTVQHFEDIAKPTRPARRRSKSRRRRSKSRRREASSLASSPSSLRSGRRSRADSIGDLSSETLEKRRAAPRKRVIALLSQEAPIKVQYRDTTMQNSGRKSLKKKDAKHFKKRSRSKSHSGKLANSDNSLMENVSTRIPSNLKQRMQEPVKLASKQSIDYFSYLHPTKRNRSQPRAEPSKEQRDPPRREAPRAQGFFSYLVPKDHSEKDVTKGYFDKVWMPKYEKDSAPINLEPYTSFNPVTRVYDGPERRKAPRSQYPCTGHPHTPSSKTTDHTVFVLEDTSLSMSTWSNTPRKNHHQQKQTN